MPTSGRNNLYFKIKSLFKPFPVIAAEGFTLIELLIVVAITGVLSTVILANFNSFGARQEVRNTAEEFKTELRKYQTFAIAGQKNPLKDGSDTDCYTVPGVLDNYRIAVIDKSYRTVNARSTYLVTLHCSSPITQETIVSPKRISKNETIIIEEVGSGATSCTNNYVLIYFKPLNRSAEFTCAGAPIPILSVYIKISNGTTQYKITVTQTGEINVKKL